MLSPAEIDLAAVEHLAFQSMFKERILVDDEALLIERDQREIIDAAGQHKALPSRVREDVDTGPLGPAVREEAGSRSQRDLMSGCCEVNGEQEP
jgi:hypothetical protein